MNLRATGIFLAILSVAPAAVAQDPADFDIDKNGSLSQTEIAAFYLHYLSPPLEDIDLDKNGIVDSTELTTFTDINLADVIQLCGDPPYPLATVTRCLPAKPKNLSLGGILIRRSYEAIDWATAPTSVKKAKPALLSYAHDRGADSSQWQVQGSILRPFKIYSSPDRVTTILAVPSVTFDRLKTSKTGDDEDEVDSMVARVGFDFETTRGPFDLQNYRLYLSYGSDFSFDQDVRALEADWEPQYLKAGIGVYRNVARTFGYRLRFVAHFEGGKVFDGAGNPDLVNGESFARIGPKIQLDLQPVAYKRLTLSTGWTYMYGLSGEPDQTRLFDASLILALDEVERVSVEVVFQKGQIPLTLEDKDTIEVGVGVKF